MTPTELLEILKNVSTFEKYGKVRGDIQRIRENEEIDLFRLFWPIALNVVSEKFDSYGNSDSYASYLLIDFNPDISISCHDALKQIAVSELNLSNREIPFYLISHFGKQTILKEYELLVISEYSNKEIPGELSGIKYWLGFSSAFLIEHYYNWIHNSLKTN